MSGGSGSDRKELRTGRITHQRKRADGSWEEIPGWISVDSYGNCILTVLSEDEVRAAEQFSEIWSDRCPS